MNHLEDSMKCMGSTSDLYSSGTEPTPLTYCSSST